MWLDDELDIAVLQSLTQSVELFNGKHDSEVRDWNIMHIYVIAMLLRFELITNKANSQQMIVEPILNGLASAADFLSFDDPQVKLMRDLQGIGGNGDLKLADTHGIRLDDA